MNGAQGWRHDAVTRDRGVPAFASLLGGTKLSDRGAASLFERCAREGFASLFEEQGNPEQKIGIVEDGEAHVTGLLAKVDF